MTDTMDQTAAMASLMAGQQQLTDMMGAGGFGQQMDASLLNEFNAVAQAAFMQQQPPMQNNFGCGFSPIPDPNATNPCFSALPDANAMSAGMQPMGDALAQPAPSVMNAQPPVDLG